MRQSRKASSCYLANAPKPLVAPHKRWRAEPGEADPADPPAPGVRWPWLAALRQDSSGSLLGQAGLAHTAMASFPFFKYTERVDAARARTASPSRLGPGRPPLLAEARHEAGPHSRGEKWAPPLTGKSKGLSPFLPFATMTYCTTNYQKRKNTAVS